MSDPTKGNNTMKPLFTGLTMDEFKDVIYSRFVITTKRLVDSRHSFAKDNLAQSFEQLEQVISDLSTLKEALVKLNTKEDKP